MKLKYVTCSGANEFTNIAQLVALMKYYPCAEIGIQVSEKKCNFDAPRYHWIMNLNDYANQESVLMNVALHINENWVEDFCFGQVAPEIQQLLSLKNFKGKHFIQRVQLNFKIGREATPNAEILMQTIRRYPSRRFILSYNESNKAFIDGLYRAGLDFDCLYDSSFGEGIEPETRGDVAFKGVLQGYAGGLSPKNVKDELWKINAMVAEDAEVYVDAEGRLKGSHGINLLKCAEYIRNALEWNL